MPSFTVLGFPVIAGNIVAAPVEGAPEPDVIEPELIVPEDIAPDDTAPDDIPPDDMVPEDIAPEDVAPDDIAPDDMELDDVAPELMLEVMGADEPPAAALVGDELEDPAVVLEPQAPSTSAAAATPAIMDRLRARSTCSPLVFLARPRMRAR